MRHYEIVLLVHPDQSQQIRPLAERYTQLFQQNQGVIHRQEDWGRLELAYQINKLRKAHFLLFNIEVDEATLNEVESSLRYNDSILRHMILRRDGAVTSISPMMEQILEANKAKEIEKEKEKEAAMEAQRRQDKEAAKKDAKGDSEERAKEEKPKASEDAQEGQKSAPKDDKDKGDKDKGKEAKKEVKKEAEPTPTPPAAESAPTPPAAEPAPTPPAAEPAPTPPAAESAPTPPAEEEGK